MSDLSPPPSSLSYSPEQLALGENLYQLFTHRQSGHCLPDCYNNIGSPLWDYFEKIQSTSKLKHTYDVAVLGTEMVKMYAADIVQLVIDDPDLDTNNLIVVEKGGGGPVATRDKTLIILNSLHEAGVSVKLYANIEGSDFFRKQNQKILKQEKPDLLVNELDADFNTDDPDLSCEGFQDEGQPRLVIELGSPRSNVPTHSANEFPTNKLAQFFNNDARLCKGGMLIMDCDSTQDGDINEGMYTHPAHARVGDALLVHGQRQGVISDNFDPTWFFYEPEWEKQRSLLKHNLISAVNQDFNVLRKDGKFYPVITPEDGTYTHSHSFKWQPKILRKTAHTGGNFKQKAFFPIVKDGISRVNGYAFKAL